MRSLRASGDPGVLNNRGAGALSNLNKRAAGARAVGPPAPRFPRLGSFEVVVRTRSGLFLPIHSKVHCGA